MPQVVSFGELLIDFVPTISNVNLIDAPAFKKAPGGAPANVAVGLARLGVSTGFMGKVGDDAFGHFLVNVLSENHVDVSAMRFSKLARTALAFVSLDAKGEREFMFYRHPSADMLFSPDEIDSKYILGSNIFHFGSITLISEPSKSATMRALEIARQGKLLISYDPNLRINLWQDEPTARDGILSVWTEANIIKISEEELQFLSGTSDVALGTEALWHPGMRLLVVTKGSKGCTLVMPGLIRDVPGFPVEAVDTTGAGDGFMAGLIYGLLENQEDWHEETTLSSLCSFANAVGALTTTQRGAIPALPTKQQVLEFLEIQ